MSCCSSSDRFSIACMTSSARFRVNRAAMHREAALGSGSVKVMRHRARSDVTARISNLGELESRPSRSTSSTLQSLSGIVNSSKGSLQFSLNAWSHVNTHVRGWSGCSSHKRETTPSSATARVGMYIGGRFVNTLGLLEWNCDSLVPQSW